MTVKERETFDLLVKMIENLTTQVSDLSKKLSNDVAGIHSKIDDHIKGPCTVQKELSEHKTNHTVKTTQNKMSFANWVSFVGVAAAILIAILK